MAEKITFDPTKKDVVFGVSVEQPKEETERDKLRKDMEGVLNSSGGESFVPRGQNADAPPLEAEPIVEEPEVSEKEAIPVEAVTSKELVDYSSVVSLDGLIEQMKSAGLAVNYLRGLAEYIKSNPKLEFSINGDLFSHFPRAGGLRGKIFELLYTKTRSAETQTSVAPEKHEEPVDFSKAGSFDELYSMLRSLRSVKGSSGVVYLSEGLINKIDTLRQDISDYIKKTGLKSIDVHGGAFDGITYEHNLRHAVVELMKKENGLLDNKGPAENLDEKTIPAPDASLSVEPFDVGNIALDKDEVDSGAPTVSKPDKGLTLVPDAVALPQGEVPQPQQPRPEIDENGMRASDEEETAGEAYSRWAREASERMKDLGGRARVQAGILSDTAGQALEKVQENMDEVRGRVPTRSFEDVEEDKTREFVHDVGERMKDLGSYASTRVGMLSEGAKWVLGKMYEKTGAVNVVDRVRALYEDRVARWHTGWAIKDKAKMEDRMSKVEKLNVDIANEKNDQRRAKLEKLRDGKEDEVDVFRRRINERNAKRTDFENKRNGLCTDILDRYGAKMRPFREKISELNTKAAELDNTIKDLQEQKNQLEARYLELDTLYKQLPIKQQEALRAQMKGLRDEQARWSGVISKAKSEHARIGKLANKAAKRIAPWIKKDKEIRKIAERRKDISGGLESSDRNAKKLQEQFVASVKKP